MADILGEQAGQLEQSDNVETQQTDPSTDQFLTKAEFESQLGAKFSSLEENILKSVERTLQSRNDKFLNKVNKTIESFSKMGVSITKEQAENYVKEQESERESEKNDSAKNQTSGAPQIDQNKASWLNKKGFRNTDPTLDAIYERVKRYGVDIEEDDPEWDEFFTGKNFGNDGVLFQDTYTEALKAKARRLKETSQDQFLNPSAVPTLAGNGAKSNAIPNTMSGRELLARGIQEELRKNKR